jgi:hypothetical protein
MIKENLLAQSLELKLNNAITSVNNDETIFEDRGFLCIIRQVDGSGHLCGYVITPMTHKINKETYANDWDIPLNCHGGVTFTENLTLHNLAYNVIGFDCNHGCDYSPLMPFMGDPSNYKDVNYVTNELKNMVTELLGMDELNTIKEIEIIKPLLLG